MNGFGNEGVDHSEDRNTEEHTEHTEQTAHQNDRKHNPDTADTNTVAEDGRTENVAVDLLNHQNDGGEDEGCAKTAAGSDQDDHSARNGTEEGTKHGNDIGHTDDQRDHRVVGGAEDPKEKIYDDHNDGRVDDLTADKLTEFDVNRFGKMAECHVATEGEKGEAETFDLFDQEFLGSQEVDRKDQTDQEVGHCGNKRYQEVCCEDDHTADVALQAVDQALQINVCDDDLIDLGEGIVIVDGVLEIERNAVGKVGCLCDEVVEALNELRNEDKQKACDKEQEERIGDDKTDGTAPLFANAMGGNKIEHFFTATQNRIHQIRNDDTEKDGADDCVEEVVPHLDVTFFIDHKADTKYSEQNNTASIDRVGGVLFIELPFHKIRLPSGTLFMLPLYMKRRKKSILFFKSIEKNFSACYNEQKTCRFATGTVKGYAMKRSDYFQKRLDGGDVITNTRFCPAKINLFLEVTGCREDGYHTIESVMQKIALCDRLTLTISSGEGITITSNDRSLPTGEKNLCYRAADFYLKAAGITARIDMVIEKRIPIAAGMAGGSTDAAGVLKILDETIGALNKKELAALALSLGADVPFCLFRSASICRGLGEELSYVKSLSSCHILVAKDRKESVSTKDAYKMIDSLDYTPVSVETVADALEQKDMNALALSMMNRFEDVILPLRPAVSEIKETMRECGATVSMMSGSGPSVFGIFEKEEDAKKARELLREKNCFVFLTRPWC